MYHSRFLDKSGLASHSLISMDLSKRLPENGKFSTLHFRTNAYQCKPLTITKDKPTTLKIKHLFLLKDQVSRCVVLGIEIYVYLSFNKNDLIRHLFVLKADTTGLGSTRFSAAEVVLELINYLIGLNPEEYYNHATFWDKDNESKDNTKKKGPTGNFVGAALEDLISQLSEYSVVNDLRKLSEQLLVEPEFYKKITSFPSKIDKTLYSELPFERPSTLNTKVSLFTRSADAYIFPESHKNPSKHVASGNQLFGWWITLLSKTIDKTWDCKADIPGSDSRSIERFLPKEENWSRGNIYVSKNEGLSAIRSIPLFPDDPKGRFLEHLVVENRYQGMSTKRYWDELAFRQEFRLGNVVGIIGCSSNDAKKIGGLSEDRSVMICSRKQYKKVHDFIKGEDYNNADNVSEMFENGLTQILALIGVSKLEDCVVGCKKPTTNVSNKEARTLEVRPVTNLTGLIKKRKKQ